MSAKRRVGVSAVLGLVGPALVGLLIDMAPVEAQMAGMRGDDHMFRTAPAQEQKKVRIIGDDRFKDEPITVSPWQTDRGRFLYIEGDMIVGRDDKLLEANLNRLAEEARLLDVNDPNLRKLLADGQLELINILKRLPAPPDADQLQKTMAEAKVAPLINQVIELVTKSQGQRPSTLLTNDLVAVVNRLVAARQNMPPAQRSVGIVGARFRWPAGVIPYFLDTNTLSASLPQTINDAIAHWNSRTDCIFLRPSRANDPYFIEFVGSTGCASNIGKTVDRGAQQIFLADGCAFDQVVHEIGHAVGLFHEQSRNDRDTFLIIQVQNAQDNTAPNFQLPRRNEAQDYGPFDFASVMLYGSDAFSANGQPTMVVRDPFSQSVGTNWGINHRQLVGLRGLSKGDVAGVAAMYENVKANRDPNLDLNTLITAGAPAQPRGLGPTPSPPAGQPAPQGAPPVRPPG